MTFTTLVLFAAAGVVAALNWLSRLRHDRFLELVTKPTVMGLLIAALIWAEPTDTASATWVLAALCFSLAGDVFLMFNRFVYGLAAFLVAHIAYIGAFSGHLSSDADAFVGAIGVVIISGVYVWQVVPYTGRLKLPVLAYVAVIAVMVSMAGATKIPIVAASALAFFLSDALIGWTRFRDPVAWAPVTIMVTYHLAQFGFVVWAAGLLG